MAELMTFGEMNEVLARARETYGNKNQIMVCIEELNELACVLAKYPRYADEEKATQELHDKALDEVADVYTILMHVKEIMGITEDELLQRRILKVNRVKKWLSHSESMQETVDDRDLEEDMSGDCRNAAKSEKLSVSEKKALLAGAGQCHGCRRFVTETVYDRTCVHCLKAQATEGRAPFKITVEP